MAPLLQVKDVSVSFQGESGWVQAVRNVSFDIEKGQIVGLVGESGCGKSVMSFSIIGLLPRRNSRIDSGEILLEGRNLLSLSPKEMTGLRGREISMIFQEPMTSLNPVFTIGNQLEEVFVNHGHKDKKENRRKSAELLHRVGISRAEEILDSYPHQLSGGMRQRVMIAMAIALGPKLLIADEPTTALDVTIQAQILRLIKQLAEEDDMAVIFISHNLGVIAQLCRKIMVMYSSQIVETTDVVTLYRDPQHPYTRNLMECIPQIGMSGKKLNSIEGTVPHPGDRIPGCRFAARCREAVAPCGERMPGLYQVGEDHFCRCLKKEGQYAAGS